MDPIYSKHTKVSSVIADLSSESLLCSSYIQGVPIRVEVGPKDLQQRQCVAVRRDSGAKVTIPEAEVEKKLKTMLEDIQNSLYKK